jgi:CheY-like chemotaxis protein
MPNDAPQPTSEAPPTLMVVEPDIAVRMVIAEYLRECGYIVIDGLTADDVLTILGAGKKLDIVLSEVQLAGATDGFALARLIRQNHPDIDVILTSGAAKVADKAGDLCDEGPLDKPYHPQDVLRRIHLLRERQKTTSKS